MANPSDEDRRWFSNAKSGWSLDVVNLLVVIGESSIAEHAQVITASLPGMLPRILPAPQALLKPSRPTRMPETTARMTGVYSGMTLETVGFFANIITPLDHLPSYSFQVLDIQHAKTGGPASPTTAATQENDASHKACNVEEAGGGQDEESCLALPSSTTPRRRSTAHDRVQDILTRPTMAVDGERPAVPAKLLSPVHVLSIISCLLSTAIIVYAVIQEDGTAILGVSLISLVSTVVGYASFWRPILMKRTHTNDVPRGDVLIRTRAGAFVLVRCSEEVARELYSGTEECEYYVAGNTYRALMALGTLLLMVSVVLLGNCSWELKVLIGTSYILLNGLYWCLGMIPRSYFWDLSRYDWRDVTPPDAKRAEFVTDSADQREGHPSFTRTLWYAIRETKLTGWVERSGAAPRTEQWKKWLHEAEAAAIKEQRDWPAVQRKDDILKEELAPGETYDAAAQHAPADG